jgi:hypothetical protein
MRTQLARALKQQFDNKIRSELAQFMPTESEEILPGGRLYLWRFCENLNFYVHLQISARMSHDCFTVELACSKKEFPWKQASLDPSHVRDGAVRFRLPQLYREEWRKKTGSEPWWCLGPEKTPKEFTSRVVARIKSGALPEKDEGLMPIDQALGLIAPQVGDAIDRIKRFGMPFFQRFAEQKIQI